MSEASAPVAHAPGDGPSPRGQILAALAPGIAHELNDLLTIAMGSLEQLRRQSLDGQGAEQVSRAEGALRQVTRLTGQMLAMTRKMFTGFEIVDLNDVIREADKLLVQAAGYGTGVSLSLELAAEPLPVRLDPLQLELALLDLVRLVGEGLRSGGKVLVQTAARPAGPEEDGVMVEVAIAGSGESRRGEMQSTLRDRLRAQERFVGAAGGRIALEVEPAGVIIRLLFSRYETV
jgi:signal transduction histidine kinase